MTAEVKRLKYCLIPTLVVIIIVLSLITDVEGRRGGGGRGGGGRSRGSSGRSGSRGSSSRSFSRPGAYGRGGKSFRVFGSSPWKTILAASIAGRLLQGRRVHIYGDQQYYDSRRYQQNRQPTICYNKYDTDGSNTKLDYFICPLKNMDNSTKEYCCDKDGDTSRQYCCTRSEWSAVSRLYPAISCVAMTCLLTLVWSL